MVMLSGSGCIFQPFCGPRQSRTLDIIMCKKCWKLDCHPLCLAPFTELSGGLPELDNLSWDLE